MNRAYSTVQFIDSTTKGHAHGMRPWQNHDQILFGAHKHWSMGSIPGVEQDIEGIDRSAIAPAHQTVIKMIPGHPGDLIPIEVFNFLYGGQAWPLPLCFQHNYHLCLPLYAPDSWSPGRRIEGDIGCLDKFSDPGRDSSLFHGPSYPKIHSPDRPVGCDLRHPLKREHRGAALLPFHQEAYPEAFPQGGSSLMKDGACS
jgi:hypothetical protein